METDLKKAIDNLYEIFAIYPLQNVIEISPISESVVDQNLIRHKNLKELTADDLIHYSMKAMTTWGNLVDFKHFLPRLMELSLKDFDSSDSANVFEKLEYGNWSEWEISEQEAIKSFILSWWKSSTLSQVYFQGDNLVYFIKMLGNAEPLLNSWSVNIQNATFVNLMTYILETFQVYKVNKHISEENYKKISKWLVEKLDKIEQGFYFYEHSNPDLSQKISYCYDIVKHLAY